ncbi:MAG: hypothetical protein ABI840_02265 [bacterium]
MSIENKYLDVLQNLEFAIQSVYKTQKDLTDYEVLFAIESLIEFYTAQERKREPRDFKLSENSIKVFAELKSISDFRIGKRKLIEDDVEVNIDFILISELLNCLKKIKNSLNKWTKIYGRQGYLNFVKNYMPDV